MIGKCLAFKCCRIVVSSKHVEDLMLICLRIFEFRNLYWGEILYWER